MRRRDFGWGYYKPSPPRAAAGGIKARTRSGAFGKSWWARRWIEVLESFNIGKRLGRGRSYARGGQVTDIDISEGKVRAKVQGSRQKPYDVRIEIKTLTLAEWKKAADVLCREALFAAKLLAGEMPENIEEAFRAAGLSLFPRKREDIGTECSCPDWSNPCKHIAAVYYLLGEEFDRDPFLLFLMRGMSRERLVGLISGAAGRESGKKPGKALPVPDRDSPRPDDPLPADTESFWGKEDAPAEPTMEVRIPTTAAALPRRLGGFPFWRGGEDFLDAIARIYSSASDRGMAVFLGSPIPAPGPGRANGRSV